MERRPAAIMSAEMAGCSRLMGADEEEGVLVRQKGIGASSSTSRSPPAGASVKSTGDGLLSSSATRSMPALRGYDPWRVSGRRDRSLQLPPP